MQSPLLDQLPETGKTTQTIDVRGLLSTRKQDHKGT
jgi:hypothetical protein